MKRISVVSVGLAVLIALAACADSYPGGNRAGDGGAGGTEDVAVRPVALPGLEVPVRSQLFAPVYGDDGLLPAGYVVYLLDQPRACASPDGLRLDEGEGWIRISFGAPARGDCAVHGGQANQPAPDEERAPPAPGCTAFIEAGRGGATLTEARGGTVRIDRLAADVLAGELRLSLPTTPVATHGCNLSWSNVGHGWELDDASCSCVGASGPFECGSTDEDDQDCCDDGVPLVEVVVPFEATRCPDAGRCWAQPCAPYLVDSCRLAAAAPASCEAACEAYVSVCRDCTGCDAVSCEAFGRCEPDACLDRCRALAGADPLVDLSLACLEAATTCDEWASCVSACGP